MQDAPSVLRVEGARTEETNVKKVGWGRGLHQRAQILPHIRALRARGMTESLMKCMKQHVI